MGVRISQLKTGATRTISIPVGGDTLTVTYLPETITPAMEDRMHAMAEDQRGAAILVEFVISCVTAWDLLGDDGEMLPIIREAMAPLPVSFLADVVRAIGQDIRPSSVSAGRSGATS
ncbi:MAG: hypothetical protein HY689_00215 [Chloroflexi bacterium]|nr:hypothetical protein [Chloroflexota bacterium]